ncbi:hypothetical protein PVAND_003464 [Polypedilum vanderplanki]|uniref:Nucleosome assembly protein n=1 Tax=Polypedilum vanderplanki TaxID=319348 RepID=A0A9J6BU49_POLVA|nr:hypothetical protein PVAND_003464 [Polypedilum vanderplanki]
MEPSTSKTIICGNESSQLKELMNEYFILKQKNLGKNVLTDLHPSVRKRICALKNLQKDTISLDAEFQRDVYKMEKSFQSRHDEIFKKRSDIINGNYEPQDNECYGDFKVENTPAEGETIPQGIPNFWLTVLKNVSVIRPMIQEQDEQVLENLIEIRALSESSDNLTFTLEFHFKPNKFFKNSVLTKTYLMKCVPDEDDPFTFEGPEIFKSVGCAIMWNQGFNVTEKMCENDKTQSIFKTDSFFNFFSPPDLNLHVNTPESDRIEEYLENDFEVGHYLKERVIPRAVLYYTGEIDDSISDDDDESMTNLMENFDQVKTENDEETDDD